MQKSLDQMNVQVHRAVTDITGSTGMVYRAIVAGERNPSRLAVNHRSLCCCNSVEEIAQHLTGNWRGTRKYYAISKNDKSVYPMAVRKGITGGNASQSRARKREIPPPSNAP